MSITGIQRLQAARTQNGIEGQSAAKDDMDGAKKMMEKKSKESYDKALEKVEADADAREASSLGRLFGSILLGPLIGTAVGEAVGEAANEGDEEASRAAEEAVGRADLATDDAAENLDDAKDSLKAETDNIEDAEDFHRELRDAGEPII